ncbi:MAG: ribosome silencing factor [Firmicutes bacterium]|nr:ribosome silencing factor [Bacillota bacterium]
MNTFDAVKIAYKALDDKMGIDITVLDIREVSPIADYFLIASASNSNQLKAMADEVDEKLYKEADIKLNHAEGFQTKSWILLDFGDIIVHLFNEEDRAFYNIERIWGDAKFIDTETLK